MKIELQRIKIKDLIKGYERDEESGAVFGYNKNLNIRPPYQREFVYKDKQRDEVIRTVFKEFPLNSIYWVKNGKNSYEVLDGQQRTISICDYYNGSFSVDEIFYQNLPENKKEAFLNYELMIYICEGKDSEKLEWFRVINIAGVTLTDQELRNAVYVSAWLSDAKRRFSKQKGICANKKCPNAGKKFEIEEMEADHIKAWSKGGKTTIENCQMLCRECNRAKSSK